MEPEEIIREKILQHDLLPVLWERDRVWQNVTRTEKPGKKVFYYAAASLALAVLIFFLIQVRNHTESPITQFESPRSKPADVTSNSTLQTLPSKNETVLVVPKKDVNEKELIFKEEDLQLTMIISPDSSELTNVSIVGTDSVSTVQLAVIDTLQTVEAIIGFIPKQSQTSKLAKKSKAEKIKFEFSKEHKSPLSGDRDKHSLTARIN